MLDFVRKHTKWLMVVLFVLIIPSFVLFGIEGYTRFNEGATKVATVDGRAITQTEWDHAHRLEVERMRASNPQLDLALLDSPEMRYATLERLVRERVLTAAAQGGYIHVSDERLASELRLQPGIAELQRADGSMDMQTYQDMLARQGLTPEGFEAIVRTQLAQQQVLGGLVQSTYASPAQAKVSMDALLEQREIRVAEFKASDYAAKVQPTDAELQAYYDKHQARYQTPETVDAQYVVLDLDAIKRSITVSEDELRAYYDNNRGALGTAEERRAAHILINAPKDAPAAEREKAKAEATALLEKVRQAPDSFADVARQSSQDSLSAESGGDLGYFQSGKGVDPAITQATYALAKEGDISDLVESDFGYHIVQLTGIKAADAPPFEQLRAQLEEQVRTQQAERRFAEEAEDFRNTVYEQSDSLQPVADKLKLEVHTAEGLGRAPAENASGPLANAKLLSELFGPESLERQRNTEAMETGPNQIASARVLKHHPAQALPFDQVKDQVREAYVSERAAELARTEGQARIKAWTDKPEDATSSLGDAVVISRQELHGQPPQVVDAVLRADANQLPLFVGVNLAADGFAVVRVEKIVPREEGSPEQAQEHLAQYDQLWGLAELGSYLDLLMQRYKAKILVPEPVTTVTFEPTSTPAR